MDWGTCYQIYSTVQVSLPQKVYRINYKNEIIFHYKVTLLTRSGCLLLGEGCFLRPRRRIGGVERREELREENDPLCVLVVLLLRQIPGPLVLVLVLVVAVKGLQDGALVTWFPTSS